MKRIISVAYINVAVKQLFKLRSGSIETLSYETNNIFKKNGDISNKVNIKY